MLDSVLNPVRTKPIGSNQLDEALVSLGYLSISFFSILLVCVWSTIGEIGKEGRKEGI